MPANEYIVYDRLFGGKLNGKRVFVDHTQVALRLLEPARRMFFHPPTDSYASFKEHVYLRYMMPLGHPNGDTRTYVWFSAAKTRVEAVQQLEKWWHRSAHRADA